MNAPSELPRNNITVDETSLGFMLRLAGPMVVTTTSFTLMQFVDRIMVSKMGTAALAATLVWPRKLRRAKMPNKTPQI